ncbi:SDR family oxidoreductase [Neobacillus novalis]|uniref:SDR family oxidoreductase n=1 Tax=Neobacillus novalis TaxID=220687 RepID=A0AA95MHQ5_9BACI|nr:SDR family oxidoreductase [Neobacillus novalis]WHY83992.1 SDR family oxidoreductase [Neobacillus novalis]
MNVLELFKLEGKVAIITGGGQGLGKQIATALAEAGCNIVLCSRKIETCADTAYRLMNYDVKAKAYKCDITKEEEIQSLIDNVIKEFGKIDILVNNSGTNWAAPVEEMPLVGWEKVIKVNLTGTFLTAKIIGKKMIEQGFGKIINISSCAGLRVDPPEILDAVGYSTSKAAVVHLTKDLAMKWGKHGINVNALAPGYFPTKMTMAFLEEKGEMVMERSPLKRIGDDNSLKGAAIFLASDASDFVTGQVLAVDGGFSL